MLTALVVQIALQETNVKNAFLAISEALRIIGIRAERMLALELLLILEITDLLKSTFTAAYVHCRCQCHGHGHICDPVTGEKCNCQNNTESDCPSAQSVTSKGSGDNECWRNQCSKCRESYMGKPTDGHQCYKQMSVDLKFCLDAKLIGEISFIS